MTSTTTLQQIAADLNLSPMSVSRALQGRQGVSEETRIRVIAAAGKRGYRPNTIARALVTGRTLTFGVLACEFTAPTSSGILTGVEEAARERGYRIQLTLHQRDEASTLAAIDEMVMHRTDGIISISARADDIPWAAEALDRTGRPYVTAFHGDRGEPRADAVVVDHAQGAHLATRYLLDRGRVNLAFAGGPSDRLATRARYEGFLKAFHEVGREPDPRWTMFDEFSVSGGLRMAGRLFARSQHPDAVFASNDDIAAGMLRGIRAAGLHVPGDVAVIGFTGSPLCEATDPPLSTVALPLCEVGRGAVARLIEHIDHTEAWRPCLTRLPCRLVLRESA